MIMHISGGACGRALIMDTSDGMGLVIDDMAAGCSIFMRFELRVWPFAAIDRIIVHGLMKEYWALLDAGK